MKFKNKRIVALMSILVLSLSACSLFSLATLLKTTIGVYSITTDKKSGKDIEEYKVGDFDFCYKDGEEYLPYLTLSTYNAMISPYLKPGFKLSVQEGSNSVAWIGTEENGEYIFAAEINPRVKSVYSAGTLTNALNVGQDYSKSSFYMEMKNDSEVIRQSSSDPEHYYGNTTYVVYRRNNETYFPLSLLDSAFSSYTGISHIFNYNRIIQYDEYDQLNGLIYKIGTKDYTAFSEMKSVIEPVFDNVMPYYLRKDRMNAFLFIMDAYYGLAYTRKIGSMANYYKSQAYYDYFLSEDTDKRNEAFYAALGLLDDGHTGVDADENAPWYTQTYSYGGSHISNMVKVRKQLTENRKAFYENQGKEVGDIIYSSSGELAFISFDSFNFEENAYNPDGVTIKPNLHETDTYFYFVKTLREIALHYVTKTVVIDVSLNGGGVVGILMKLLALLSKDNHVPIYIMEDTTNMVQKECTSVDSNGDGQYNQLDVFGDKFKFVILTSDYSFSCANAFPFYAKKVLGLTTIGQTSGGGECTVDEAHLPSGEHFFHSSNLHLGFFDEDARMWEGDEKGVEPEERYKLDYDHFYDIELMDSLLN